MSRAIARTIWLILIISTLANAQLDRGSLTGTVTDPTGAVIPDVKVSARNTATNAVYETRSEPAGQYTMPNLPVGGYEVTFEAPAFKKLVRSGIALGVAEVLRIDAMLEVGSLSESVQITAEAPRLTSDTPMTGTSLTSRDLTTLPLTRRTEGRVAQLLVYK